MAFRVKTDISEFYKNDAKLVSKKNKITDEMDRKGQVRSNWSTPKLIDLNEEIVPKNKAETFSEKVARDVKAVTNYMTSIDGMMFNAKQQGLHLSSPNLYKDNQNKEYNPASILAATAIGYTGLRPIRPGYELYEGRDYESFIKDLNSKGQNRLVSLTKEILRNDSKKEGSVIDVISGITGPNTLFGIGRTDIHLHHPTNKVKDDAFTPYLDGLYENIENPKNEEHGTNIDIPNISIPEFGNLYTKDSEEQEIKEKIKKEVKFPKSTVKDIGNPNKYSVLSYDQLERDGEFGDFRNRLDSEEITGKGFDREDNVVSRFGMIDAGKTRDRSDITKSEHSDKINILNENEENDEVEDFVKFKVRDINNSSRFIIFRSTFTTLNDDISPSWDSQNIPGRADMIYKYTSFERSFSTDFVVPTYSRPELISNYRRLNELAKYTLPTYDKNKGFRSPFIRLTIGDYFVDTPGFIDSLNYQVDESTSWEINLENDDDIGELPKNINVSLTFTVISDVVPSQQMNFFSILDNIL